MKIIHLISGGDVGGAKTHVLSLLAGLRQTETVRLVCFMDGPFAQEARALGIDTLIVDSNHLSGVVATLRRVMAEGEYQIVHCHGARANLIGALLRRHITVPVVTTVHSDYRLDYLGRPMGRLTYGTINTVALRYLDYYIGVSDHMSNLLITRGFDPQRMFSIYNGVDFVSPRNPVGREAYLDSVGVTADENTVVFGIAARLSAVKDIGTLIRAFAAAQKTCPNIRLVIAGDGEQRAELERLAAEVCPDGTCVFAGWVSDMTSFYDAIDVNTLSSVSEGFPYALPEGARMHCATIASRVGGVPYLIEHGVTGLLFEPRDTDTLTRYMVTIVSDSAMRHRLGEALYERTAKDFSVEATVRHQKEIYGAILRRQARAPAKRDGVMICGAYGRDNAGDDAILAAIVQQMRTLDSDLPIYVLTRQPKKTAARMRIGTVHTFDFVRFLRLLHKTVLYINGGGSLIQDVTSTRSLLYYLASIRAAKAMGNRVIMYGCGIGPVRRENNRRLAGRVIDRCADTITLRDPNSGDELRRMGVTRPEMFVTADPAVLLEPAAEHSVDGFLFSNGLPTDGRFALFALRPWPNFERCAPIFAAAANYVAKQYGLTPLFIALEPRVDRAICEKMARLAGGDARAVDAPASSSVLISLVHRAGLMVAMRLHALVFSAGVGTPPVAVAYDPKVTGFMEYIGHTRCLNFDTLEQAELLRQIDAAMAAPTVCVAEAAELRLQAERNKEAAKKLLEESK